MSCFKVGWLLLFFVVVVVVFQHRVVSEEVLVGTEIPGGGGRGRLYLSLYCHHQNDSCIKTGSDESHFGVFIDCEGQCHNLFRQCPQIITFEERTAEVESNRGPSAYQP